MAQVTIEQALRIAIGHHQAGQISQAQSIYQQILSQQPNHPDALHLSGVIAQQSGLTQLAVDLIRRALTHRPGWPEALFNLGIALNADNQMNEAIAAYQQAILLKPNWPQACYNLSNAFRSIGQMDQAIAALHQAISLNPRYAEAYNNLGTALRETKRHTEAITAFNSAIESQPGYAEAYCNLGVCLQNQNETQNAISAYQKAIALKPDFADAHSNLGLAWRAVGRLDQAVLSCRRAIELQPTNASAHNNLGLTLQDQDLFDQAIAAHRRAVQLSPDSAEFYAALGSALVLGKRLDEGVLAYRQAVTLRPDFPQALNNLAIALMDIGQVPEAIETFRRASELNPENAAIGSALVFAMLYHPAYNALTIFDAHAGWNQRYAQTPEPCVHSALRNREPHRRLRIGYISPDFRRHPVAQFLLPVLENYDRQQFEVFCYSDVKTPDAITARCRSLVDQWTNICTLNHQDVAAGVRADKIDILVDLSGHSTANRLLVFARKPAPLQVSYLGYPSTTGLTAIDYRLTDPWADPVGLTEQFHTEKLYRLPQTNWCFSKIEDSPAVAPAPVFQNGFITFGSFNNLAKVTDQMLETWAQILRKVPGSRMLMKTSAFQSANARERVSQIFAAHEIERHRLKLLQATADYQSHLATYNQIDIALDTFPYSGATTTCEALWMGVPVVTLSGGAHLSRVGFSLLKTVGLPELIATTTDQYINIAQALTTDLDALQARRFMLREKMQQSPVMNSVAFTRNIEAAYRAIWQEQSPA